MSVDLARDVADAVLYEGYLLYPYRATSRKNHSRWQFGVLGPPGATVVVHLRFLQLQLRGLEQIEPGESAAGRDQGFRPVPELTVDGQLMFSWDEAVEHEVVLPARVISELAAGFRHLVTIDGGEDTELIMTAAGETAGRVIRRRWPLHADVRAETTQIGDYLRLTLVVENTGPTPARTSDDAIRTSLIGAHLLIETHGRRFVSLLEPPDDAVAAVAACQQRRCWPVLAGPNGGTDVVLASPIILYDYPEIAPQSPGALFDGCEIDEILTLRVMTLTDEEKAEAMATDPLAREIIERCERMTPEELQQLHGILRDPHADAAALAATENVLPAAFSEAIPTDPETPWFDPGDVPWWDPAADESVEPELDAVTIDGVGVSKGSLVRVHPSRRADAQDLFFADKVGRVTAVISDVDGGVHVALVLVDDPAAELHDWYGRYLYFAPDELEPLSVSPEPLSVSSALDPGKESHP